MIHDLGRHFVIETSQKYFNRTIFLCFYELKKAITQLGYHIFQFVTFPQESLFGGGGRNPKLHKCQKCLRLP